MVRPRLSGICGSDLATVDGRSSRWFEPIVSFPFVPGHEVVADADDGRRVVIEPVLHCRVRGIEPPCPACAAGRTNHCERLVGGHLQPGLQTGFCADTGGGWSLALVAHEPAAARGAGRLERRGRGHDRTDGLRRARRPRRAARRGRRGRSRRGHRGRDAGPGHHRRHPPAAPRHHARCWRWPSTPSSAGWPPSSGATAVVDPGELRRAVRRATGSWILDNGQLTGGAPVVFDCVGSAASIADALAVTAPGGTVVLLGMPGHVGVDLTGLWQREIRLVGRLRLRAGAGGGRPAQLRPGHGGGRCGRPGAPGQRDLPAWTASPTPSSTPPPPAGGAR